MQGLQHETVASQRAQHVGVLWIMAAVQGGQFGQRLLRLGGGAGEKGDAGCLAHPGFLVACRRG